MCSQIYQIYPPVSRHEPRRENIAMKIWAIANQKGGVGKTTTAVSLAGVLHNRHARVLLVDLDPHGSLTSYFGADPDNIEHSGYDLFL